MKLAKISEGNSKIGSMHNVSLTPIKGCLNCQSCKRDCYALKAYRMYPQTRKAWNHNLRLATTDKEAFFASIRAHLAKKAPRFFRWHVAGDILGQDYLESMKAIARDFPGTRFLCFTKMHSLDFTGLPKNLSVVLSMFPSMPVPANRAISYGNAKLSGLPIAWMQDGTETRLPSNAIECPGSCEGCGMCFDLARLRRDVVFHKH